MGAMGRLRSAVAEANSAPLPPMGGLLVFAWNLRGEP